MNEENVLNEFESELKKLEENIENVRQTSSDTVNELKHEKSVNNAIEKLKELANANPEMPNTRDQIAMMVQCMANSITLDILFECLERTDKTKLIRIYESNFDSELRKMRKKLTRSSYHFTDVNLLLDQLTQVMPANDAKLFIFSICRFVNSQGKYFINYAAVFISQLLKNILLINSKDFPERIDFIANINKYINTIKGVE